MLSVTDMLHMHVDLSQLVTKNMFVACWPNLPGHDVTDDVFYSILLSERGLLDILKSKANIETHPR